MNNQTTFRLYYVDFDTETGTALIRHPGAQLCAEIVKINSTQLHEIRARSHHGIVPRALIEDIRRAQ